MSDAIDTDGDVKQWYVVYLDKSGDLIDSHGGPYPPQKAREVRDGMQSDIDRGNYSDWSIPENAEEVEIVTPEKYQEMKREMLGINDD